MPETVAHGILSRPFPRGSLQTPARVRRVLHYEKVAAFLGTSGLLATKRSLPVAAPAWPAHRHRLLPAGHPSARVLWPPNRPNSTLLIAIFPATSAIVNPVSMTRRAASCWYLDV